MTAPKRVNWRRIADRLASRLMYHTYCDNGHTEPDDECPFCQDIAAYDAYVEAGGTRRLTSFNDAVVVDIADLMRSDTRSAFAHPAMVASSTPGNPNVCAACAREADEPCGLYEGTQP